MLLLGYSVEMFLKAGLVKVYRGCSEEMFTRDVQQMYGHKYLKIAEEIAFPFEAGDELYFQLLKTMVHCDARYPVIAESHSTYANRVNKITHDTWDTEKFMALVNLADRIRKHALKIDMDRYTPASVGSWKIDDDGYITTRYGGHLPSRITYCPSSQQIDDKKAECQNMKELYHNLERLFGVTKPDWNTATIICDGKDKTRKLQ
ncbi:MAG: hypothetical protein COA60_007355 [Robiginitomaculum sp.]|nr:hypothetical protein [Robiginitomaculum sp.]